MCIERGIDFSMLVGTSCTDLVFIAFTLKEVRDHGYQSGQDRKTMSVQLVYYIVSVFLGVK